MNIEEFRSFCLTLPEVTEEFPFGKDTLVYKVKGRIFAITNIELFDSVNLKCDPEKAVYLREKYNEVQPGYHMNKKHWNTVLIEGSISNKLLVSWIKESYNLVVEKLPKSLKAGPKPSKLP